jgi:uncharacterized protein YcbX
VSATVAAISITPVKALALHHPAAVQLDRNGAVGNREFFLVDERGDMVNAKRIGALLTITAEHDPAEGTLALSFADGSAVAAQVQLGAPEETRFFGEPVPARAVVGPFDEAISAYVGERLRLFAPDGERAVDRGPAGAVSLISRASLERLAEEADGNEPVDARRFRMLFVIDGVEAHAEDAWIGSRLRIGAATVEIGGNVGRCAVTTRNPQTGVVDFPTLQVLASYRGDVETTERLPFGIYGGVVEPGRVAVGDEVDELTA